MKILFFGDSITDMERNREECDKIHSYGDGFVFFVAGDLARENPEKYEVVNKGISGNRIVDLYARVKADVWNEKPDVLTILIGTNDVWHDMHDNPNGVELDRFIKVYKMLLEDTKKKLPKTKIILLTPFFLHGTATDEKYGEFKKIKDYAAAVENIAKEFSLPLISLQKKFDEAIKKHDAKYYLLDGVHPDVAGARLIADEWLKKFKEIEKEVDK